MQLTGLHRYPVKSMRGEALRTAVVEACGLAGDRRWMLVGEDHDALTARECRSMLLIAPQVRAGGGLLVRAEGHRDLEVARPEGTEPIEVSLFHAPPFTAAGADPAADAWFSEVLDRPVRLVFSDDPSRRPADPAYAGAGVPMAFGDGYPLMVTTEESLVALNALIADGPRADEGGLAMTRFRPNLVVTGDEAWAEDGWRRLRVGAATFRAVKGCERCVITATDPETAERFKEPTATLARHRRWNGAVWFGMNLVAEDPGAEIGVGDEVEVLERVTAPEGPPR